MPPAIIEEASHHYQSMIGCLWPGYSRFFPSGSGPVTPPDWRGERNTMYTGSHRRPYLLKPWGDLMLASNLPYAVVLRDPVSRIDYPVSIRVAEPRYYDIYKIARETLVHHHRDLNDLFLRLVKAELVD
jgi:hypothetical protein